MEKYNQKLEAELEVWRQEMLKEPGLSSKFSKALQVRINNLIPDKIHKAISIAIKQMVRAMIFGSIQLTRSKYHHLDLNQKDAKVLERISIYSNTSAAEGAATGAGGILLGLADFPIWLTLKLKMLHDIANIYGFNVRDYKERIYMLYIFQLTFSSQVQRNKTFPIIDEWYWQKEALPKNINDFDWKTFQIEYRDYLDIAKLLQLIPGIGAFVGAFVNHRLTQKLGRNAVNAYHMRLLNESKLSHIKNEPSEQL